MARLLSWQAKVAQLALVSGPASAGSGSNTLADGSEQSFAGQNYALAFELSFPPSQFEQARKEFAWMMALHNGANATCYVHKTGDEKTPAEVGESSNVTWIGGSWTGGTWAAGHGTVALALDAAKGATIVHLANSKWGHSLEFGDRIGFHPAYFGSHKITQVFANGAYRIEPPLRAALTADTHRTNFFPRLALRFVPGSVNYGSFSPAFSQGRSARFVEVFDEYVTTYFGD